MHTYVLFADQDGRRRFHLGDMFERRVLPKNVDRSFLFPGRAAELGCPIDPHVRHRLFKMNVELDWFEQHVRGREYTWEKAPVVDPDDGGSKHPVEP